MIRSTFNLSVITAYQLNNEACSMIQPTSESKDHGIGSHTDQPMSKELAKLVSAGHHAAALQYFASLLKSCGTHSTPHHGQALHAHLIKLGGSHQNPLTSTSLLSMYLHLGHISNALKLFDEMPQPNTVSVTALISGLSQNGRNGDAFMVFRDVGVWEFRPNSVMIASVLSGCDDIENGRQVHCWGVKLGVVERDVYVGTALVTMYMKCGEVGCGRSVFGRMKERNVVSYNAFVTGLLQNGVCRGVLEGFKDMVVCGEVRPNGVTFVSVLGACSDAKEVEFGRQVHGFGLKVGLCFDTMMGTVLVDMYCKCGSWRWGYDVFVELVGNRNLITWNSMIAGMMKNDECENAVELFDRLEIVGLVPDSATWNTMISGFSQVGKGTEALMFFKRMQSHRIAPTLKSLTSILPVCSTLCYLKLGKEIHGRTIRKNVTEDEFLVTSLIDMYMKCGESSWARRMFDRFENKPSDPAFWNAMISGYGRNGEDESAFEIFHLMQEVDIRPNSVTFLNILSVCSYNGELEKGRQVFRTMIKDYGLIPGQEHLACMINIMGRSGQLDKAKELLADIAEPSASAFSSLLSASECYLDAEVGEDMAEKLGKLEVNNSANFVTLSNIYAANGRWKDVERLRHVMDVHEVRKVRGRSLSVT